MSGKVTLDRAGRVVLPKTLRDELRLSPGATPRAPSPAA